MCVQSQGIMTLISCGTSTCGVRSVTSPICHWCSTGKTQGLWRLLHFSNNTRGSRRQHSWENRNTLKYLQLENKACKVCTKECLYLTVFQPQFLKGVKDGLSWLTLADQLCSLPAQLHTLLTGH